VFKISASGTESVLHSFGPSGGTDGDEPTAGLIMDSAGNLYGTTYGGGVSYTGTVFKISASGTESVLHSFGPDSGTDGVLPVAGLIADSAGNLYGTTGYGGTNGNGTVFKISASGTESILHSFGPNVGIDGDLPIAGLIMDSAGNLYGTTYGGGVNNTGTVFKISASGTESVLYSFGPDGGTDAQYPTAGLIMDSAGNLYGTTESGGAHLGGTVFKINASGKEWMLHSFDPFNGRTDGQYPDAGLIMDSTGNLYGTTGFGGTNGNGAVFELSPP